MRILLGCLLTVLAVVFGPAASLAQDGSYCPPANSVSAEVIQLESREGCDLVLQLALKTVVSDGGYLRESGYLCRWGQGGTRPEPVDGKIYVPGYCTNLDTYEDAWYLGRRLNDPSSQRVYVGSAHKPKGKWCPTNRTCLTKIKWTTYSSTRAVGVGRAKDCAGGGLGCRTYRKLKVVLTEPEALCGRVQFSKLRMFGRTFGPGAPPLCHVYYAP